MSRIEGSSEWTDWEKALEASLLEDQRRRSRLQSITKTAAHPFSIFVIGTLLVGYLSVFHASYVTCDTGRLSARDELRALSKELFVRDAYAVSALTNSRQNYYSVAAALRLSSPPSGGRAEYAKTSFDGLGDRAESLLVRCEANESLVTKIDKVVQPNVYGGSASSPVIPFRLSRSVEAISHHYQLTESDRDFLAFTYSAIWSADALDLSFETPAAVKKRLGDLRDDEALVRASLLSLFGPQEAMPPSICIRRSIFPF